MRMVAGVGIVTLVAFFLAFGCGGTNTPGTSTARGTGGTAGVGGKGGVAAGVGVGGIASTNIFVDTITQKSIDKIDLLFMIDNSISMADKQAVLKEAVPDLVQRLVSPSCVDPVTGKRDASTPKDPNAACASGKVREFTPVKNIHIGIITSSLGDHGDGATCVGKDGGALRDEGQDDHGHLIASRPRWNNERAKPDYTGLAFQPPEPGGFLDWNPATHPGENIDDFSTTFEMMVTASSEFGCGLEAQLESIYRFLADPKPPLAIGKGPCPGGSTQQCAFPTGKDTTLLAQRAGFLRPDSLVAAILVSDENDCSIRDERQFFYAATSPTKILLPHGSAACATNPNDPCCYSCGSNAPPSCQADPSCATPSSTAKDDQLNLRCFDQKRRFGLDFLYPIQRYVNALSKTQICTSSPDLGFDPSNPATCPGAEQNLVANPLFSDLTGAGGSRDPSLVFFAGIVGVPWQDVQATDSPATPTQPSLKYPTSELHYLTARQLAENKTWDLILGDPTPAPAGSPPRRATDGLMVEDRYPRPGIDYSGAAIPGPGATQAQNSPINGHDWNDSANDDLMYACIFPLKAPRDCDAVERQSPAPGCDCGVSFNAADNNPLCEGPDGTYGHTQFFAKAYPGIRELQVLKAFGDNAIVASICARNLQDTAAQDYGYRPALDSIVDRLKGALVGRCLPRQLASDRLTGTIPCSIVEVAPPGSNPRCDESRGRKTPALELIKRAEERLKEKGICDAGGKTPLCSAFTLCEIRPLNSTAEDPTQACHKDGVPEPSVGWCYVDPATNPADDPSLVAKCMPSERRIIRFVDPTQDTPTHGSQVLIACTGSQLSDHTP